MNRLTRWWLSLNASLWFLPALMVAVFLGLAYGMVHLDMVISHGWERHFPLLFGAGAEAARTLLATVASSMMTVAALTFTLTLATIAQVSNQYSPRIIWTFMRDRNNQVVLGSFVGIFAYCLVVLRTIRGNDYGGFIPSLAVGFALLLALLSIGVLIFFIHHIAASIEASNIVQQVARDTRQALERLFPKEVGEAAAASEDGVPPDESYQPWLPVLARVSGYLRSVDDEQLLRLARAHVCVVRMDRALGGFVAEGESILSVAFPDGARPLAPELVRRLHRTYTIGNQRTIEQDAGFGLRQIVDIALKALSPGINDTSTAIICIDHLGSLLAFLGPRSLGARQRADSAANRVLLITKRPDYEDFVTTAFDQIRSSGAANVAVLLRLLSALSTVIGRTPWPSRRSILRRQVELIREAAERQLDTEYERQQVRRRLVDLALLLTAESP